MLMTESTTLLAKGEWEQEFSDSHQHRNRPVGTTPPRATMNGISATQEITMPPILQRRSRFSLPINQCNACGVRRTLGFSRIAMIVHSIQRTGTYAPRYVITSWLIPLPSTFAQVNAAKNITTPKKN